MNNSLLIVLALIFALLLTSCSGSSIGSNHVNSVCESSQINLSSEDQDPSSEDSSFEEKSSVEELTSDSEQPPFSGVDYLTYTNVKVCIKFTFRFVCKKIRMYINIIPTYKVV